MDLHDLLLVFRLLADKPLVLAGLLRQYDSPAAIIDLISSRTRPEDGFAQSIMHLTAADFQPGAVESDLKWLQRPGHHLVKLGDADYPPLLAEIADPPVVLFCQGNLDVMAHLKIAMVGSRNPTPAGVRQARQFAGQLAGMSFAITSGLAIGIDGACHEGALAAAGATIAVLGSGCDLIYPGRHKGLAERILESGLVVSEFPLGTPAYARNFPRRNRLVTGMSLCTIVVEAMEKSGSLISARLAMEQGREVCVMPGSIQSRQSRGCHQLIRDGATLISSVDHVLAELNCLASFECQAHGLQQEIRAPELSANKQAILGVLGGLPVPIDDLCECLQREISPLLAEIVELELAGLVVSEAAGYRLA